MSSNQDKKELEALHRAVGPEHSGELKRVACEINLLSRQIDRNMAGIGRHLLRVKDMLNHGEFLRWFAKWVKIELKFSMRTATNAMNLARIADLARQRYGAEFEEKVLALPKTVLYSLGSRNTPYFCKMDVLKGIKKDTISSKEDIETTIKRYTRHISLPSMRADQGAPVVIVIGDVTMEARMVAGRITLTPSEGMAIGSEAVRIGTMLIADAAD